MIKRARTTKDVNWSKSCSSASCGLLTVSIGWVLVSKYCINHTYLGDVTMFAFDGIKPHWYQIKRGDDSIVACLSHNVLIHACIGLLLNHSLFFFAPCYLLYKCNASRLENMLVIV